MLEIFPNPFSTNTTITFHVPNSGLVELIVYDINGKKIQTLINEHKQEGEYQVAFNSLNRISGVYFYELKVGNLLNRQKMIIIK